MFDPSLEAWTKHHTASGAAYYRRGDALIRWGAKEGRWVASAFGIDLRDFDALADAQAYLDAAPNACMASQVVAAHYVR